MLDVANNAHYHLNLIPKNSVFGDCLYIWSYRISVFPNTSSNFRKSLTQIPYRLLCKGSILHKNLLTANRRFVLNVAFCCGWLHGYQKPTHWIINTLCQVSFFRCAISAKFGVQIRFLDSLLVVGANFHQASVEWVLSTLLVVFATLLKLCWIAYYNYW